MKHSVLTALGPEFGSCISMCIICITPDFGDLFHPLAGTEVLQTCADAGSEVSFIELFGENCFDMLMLGTA